MRKLTKTLAAVTLMAPLGAHPLGIGDIELHSALNERLDAEIFLNLSAGESLGDLQVKLASPEKFKEVGIPRSYFLSKIKFEPVVKPDGSVVIQLTSTGVVKEPFLDFLLEVSWPKGSMYREFSVLVDPPVTYEQPVVPVVQAPTREQTDTRPKPRQPSTVTRPAPVQPSRVQYQDLQNVDSYKVRRNDTLWEIAQRVKDDDVSVEQMMIALFDTNPDAFYQNNVNTLMLGKTLQVPDRSIALRISREEARAEFDRQTKIWRGEIAAPRQTTPASEPVSSRITLVAPTESEVLDEELVSPGKVEIDQTEVGKPSGREADTVPTSQDQAMNERMAKLEQQIQLMQKMLSMRDEQLSLLQQQLAEKEKAPQTQVQPITPEPEVIAPLEPELKPEPQPVQKPAPVEIKPPVKPAPKPEPVEQAPVTTAKPVEAPKPKPQPKVQPKPVTTTQIQDDYSLYYMIFGVVALTLLGLLGWVLWRNKMLDDEDNTESMFAASSEIILPEEDQELTIPVIDDESTYDVGTVGESSFLSEFIPSDFDAFDTEQAEVDPISEADVYLAYGRYQQAEELMRQAIEEHPERDECKLKLLEIFYSNEDSDAYIKYATELIEQGKKDEVVFWSKVAEMGSEIAPDADIFAPGGSGGAEEETSADSGDSQTHSSIESVNVDDAGLDFDFSDLDAASGSASAPAEEDEDISGSLESIEQLDDSLDLNASKAVFEQFEEEQPTDDTQVVQEKTDNVLEFDFDQSDTTESNQDPEKAESGDELFEDFDFSSDTTVEGITDTKAEESETLDFDFDLDQLAGEEEKAEPSNIYDLNNMDEFDTKIDLAKAYIDMGDPEAAKVIVEEVLQKGNAEQQQEAKQLLDAML